jgi:hypothetical protein
MKESDDLDSIINKIDQVWYEESEHYSIEYVTFLISCDIEDIRRDNFDEKESVEELADCVINSLRYMNKKGYDPQDVIENRLDDHKRKGIKNIVKKYSEKFEQKEIN